MAIALILLVSPDLLPVSAKLVWFLWSVGIGAIGLGVFAARATPGFGLIVLSIFMGTSAQLWLTEPLWFPAIQLRPKASGDIAMFGFVALQFGAAVWYLWRAGVHQKLTRLLGEIGYIRILVFLALSTAFSVSAMGYVPRGFLLSYGLHLFAGGGIILINLISLAALVTVSPPERTLRGFNPILPALVVLVASAMLAWFGFERLPHVEDEAVYLFQAQTLAQGALSVTAPPEALRPGLDFYLMDIQDGQWFSTTAPGWPAVLALGILLGVPWLVNPFLGMLSVLLAHRIALRLAGKTQADVLILLMATSPWFLGASASLMPHGTTIFFTLACWWLLLLPPKSQRAMLIRAGLAGLAMGWVFVTRQLDGAMLGVMTGLWLLWRWRQGDGFGRTVFYSLGAILTGSVYFVYNLIMTGNILSSPLARYINATWHSGANSYGFGPDIGPAGGWGDLDMATGHWPIEGVLNTAHNLSGLQLELFGWGIGSLALVFILFLWGRPSKQDYTMLAVSAVVIGALFLYWFSGGFYLGPRYWLSILFPVLFLSASGYLAFSDSLQKHRVPENTAAYMLLIMCLFGLMVFTPWRGVEKFHGYNSFRAELGQKLNAGEFGNALVFYQTPDNPASAFYLNAPDLPEDRPIFLMDMGADVNAAAMAAYPERTPVYYTATTAP